MHYPRHSRRQRLIIGLVVFGGLGLFALGLHDWLTPAVPTSPATTTVVAKAKPRPQTAPHQEKPLKTVVKNAAIDQYLVNLHFSGTALIVHDGHVVVRKGYQYRDRKIKSPNLPNTPYLIGSAQKAIVATAILQLQDAGKLKVTDPVAKYLPHFPNGHVIRLKNLLNHTSGIVGHASNDDPATPATLIKDIQAQGINAQPGQWHYLDSNYTVLAYLVEKLSGQSLATYLQRHIFQPAHMTMTGTYDTFNAVEGHPTGYKIKDGTLNPVAVGNLSQLFGVGNLYMSVTDMYRFDHALMTNKLISKAARKAMFTSGSTSTYGMGFYVSPSSYSSHGVVRGYNVTNNFNHDGRTYIVLMSNIQNNIPSFGRVTSELYRLINQATAQTTN